MRHFWRAIVILALIQCAVTHRLTGPQNTSLIQLLIRRRDALADWVSALVGINRQVAVQLLDLHTYDRDHKVPDIGVSPFLALSDGLRAASPWMLVSSAFERNLCAHLARQYSRLYDAASNPLATHLANHLVDRFTNADFKAVHSIPFQHGEEGGDVDLLVWSPAERYLMASELKWPVAPADFMEVLNRGEATCKDAMERQLPKYSRLLSADAGGFVARAFQLPSTPTIDDWSCGLIARGVCGYAAYSDGAILLSFGTSCRRETYCGDFVA